MLIVASLIWAIISLPLLFFAFLAFSAGSLGIALPVLLLSALPVGPATAGLSYFTYKVSDGRAVKIADFFVGMREYARQGWIIGTAFLAGVAIILFNIGFYGNASGIFGALMLGLWLYLFLFWVSMLIYSFPLVFLQERPEMRTMLRNAVLMVVGKPIFTFLTLVMMLLIFGLSVFLVVPLFVITPAFLNLWSMRVARYLIALDEARRQQADEKAAGPPEERGRKGQVRPK